MPEFPPVPPSHEFLTDWIFRVGPVLHSGMGPVPLPHTEIRAWALNTGEEFHGLEAEWLQRMSQAYAAELQRSSGEDVAAPWTE